MNDRILLLLVCAAAGLLVSAYFINPLGTSSEDPRLRFFGYTTYRYSSHAMEPTMNEGEIHVVSAWPYVREDPAPGDIIAFKWPLNPEAVFAQRVIAAGGSTIEIVKGASIVDGKPLQEPYLVPEEATTDYSQTMAPVHVPAGYFFVMADNRDNSNDSRKWGLVPRKAIVGRFDR